MSLCTKSTYTSVDCIPSEDTKTTKQIFCCIKQNSKMLPLGHSAGQTKQAWCNVFLTVRFYTVVFEYIMHVTNIARYSLVWWLYDVVFLVELIKKERATDVTNRFVLTVHVIKSMPFPAMSSCISFAGRLEAQKQTWENDKNGSWHHSLIFSLAECFKLKEGEKLWQYKSLPGASNLVAYQGYTLLKISEDLFQAIWLEKCKAFSWWELL